MLAIVPDIPTIAVQVYGAKRINKSRYLARCPGKRHRRGDRRRSLNFFLGRDRRWHIECLSMHCDIELEVLRPQGLSFAKLLRGSPAPLHFKHDNATDLPQALRWLAVAVLDGDGPSRPHNRYSLLALQSRETSQLYWWIRKRLDAIPIGARGSARAGRLVAMLCLADDALSEIAAELRRLS